MKSLPWFRAYTEMVDDEKLRLLAFEDRWHFVALLCLKGQGILDETGPLLFRKVAVKLGLDVRSVEEVARRLSEVGLIDEKTLQPIAWEARQFRSDSSAARVAAYRERKKQGAKRDGNVTVTAQDTDTDTDIDKEEDKKITRVRAAPTPIPDVPPTLLADYIAVRKAKRAGPLTKTALDGLRREADKAGLSLADAIAYCCEAGWQGFNAGWYAERETRRPAGQSSSAVHTPQALSVSGAQTLVNAAALSKRIFGEEESHA
jgi:hypothetical protein